MSQITIRQVEGDEMLRIIQQLPGYGLFPSPPPLDPQISRSILEERVGTIYYALFEDERAAACVAWAPMTQHVRGEVLPMGGIYDVATHPAFRRKGYARQVMQQAFAAMHATGYPVTALYPFRESFYENLGYAAFPQPIWAGLHPANLSRLMRAGLEGEVELALYSDCFDVYQDFLERYQRQQPGFGLFAHRPAEAGRRRNYWVALAKTGGEVTGAAVYVLRGERPMQYDMRILRFYYLNSQARYQLLEWAARHVDQARAIDILLGPDQRPIQWLPDIDVKVTGETFRGMGRVLDVHALNGLRVGAGRFNLQVLDVHCPWNDGAWQFSETGGRLVVERTGDADCVLKVQGLSALVYGTHDPQDFRFRGWGDPTPGLQEQMRLMFPLQSAYLHESF